jgi:type II secretory pathway component PulM
MRTWTRERKIYLAVGIISCAVVMVLIFFPR